MIVTTTKGEIDDSLLEKREYVEEHHDADGSLHDTAEIVEYWLDGECVHRSAHVKLKKMPPGMEAVAAKLFG